MKALTRPFKSIRFLDQHNYICDLLYIEGPLLCLYRDAKQNWLYLWCDTDNKKRERWLLIPVTREKLIAYLEKAETLRNLVETAPCRFLLDVRSSVQEMNYSVMLSEVPTHRQLKSVDLADIVEYLPSSDSFFNEELSPDISLARELSPIPYDVPIDGSWFFGDLQKFSQIYSQIYAFLYCTKPRFVVNIGDRVRDCLRSPWTGGYSRVNLFDALKKAVPSLHDLQIKQIRYASPGEIKIEALKSVGGSISEIVQAYLLNREPLVDAEKGINMLLASNHLRRSDLSDKSDEQLTMLNSENRKFLIEKGRLISKALNCEDEFLRLSEYSPNIVVSAKVHLALLSRVRRLAEFQSAGLINLG